MALEIVNSSYLEQLAKLKEEVKTEEKKIYHLHKEEEREIANAKDKIRKKYSNLIDPIQNRLNEHNKQINDYCICIENYCCFDRETIGKVIAGLMTLFEGKKYVYQVTECKTKQRHDNKPNSMEFLAIKNFCLIVDVENKQDTYSDIYPSELKRLIREKKLLILSSDSIKLEKAICFYTIDKDSETFCANIDFNEFYYIKEFIDYVIAYRVKNKVVEISEDKLCKLRQAFVEIKLEHSLELIKQMENIKKFTL